jgi:hypothetical protein
MWEASSGKARSALANGDFGRADIRGKLICSSVNGSIMISELNNVTRSIK